MKNFNFILGLSISILLIISLETCKSKESKIMLKADIRGTYSLNDCDSSYYFLVTTQFINNTDTTCTFLAENYNTNYNFFVDSEFMHIFGTQCSGNFPIPISLKPSQTFSIPLIIQIKIKKSFDVSKFKIGLVLLHPHTYHQDFDSIIENMKKKNLNIIWSNEMQFKISNHKQYSIE
jgi:hypothetical protein